MNVEIDENWWKLQKLKIEKRRYQKVMKIDENGRPKLTKHKIDENWWNQLKHKIDET